MKSHRTTLGITAVLAVSWFATARGDQANPPQPQTHAADSTREQPPIHPPETVFPDSLDDQQFPPIPAAPRATAPSRPTITITTADPGQRVRVALEGDLEQAVTRLTGKAVKDSAGKHLGEVAEFLISDAGKLAYLVVASAKDPDTGNSLRLVPPDAVRRAHNGSAIVVNIAAAEWAGLPSMSEQEFGTLGLAAGGGQQPPLAQPREGAPGRSDRPADGPAVGIAPTDTTVPHPAGLIRSADLRDRMIRVGDHDLGTIEAIVIDFAGGEALALVLASREFTIWDAKFLIPLSRLEAVSLRQDPITATLARDDFKQAEVEAEALAAAHPAGAPDATGGVAFESPPRALADPSLDLAGGHAPKRTATDEETLSPTGRTSQAAGGTAGVDDALAATARAVRHALENDPTLSTQNIRVETEEGKIVLRGAVGNELIKGSVERTARRAVSGATIENQIQVEQR